MMHLQSHSSWAQLVVRRVCVITTPSGRMFAQSVDENFTPPAGNGIDIVDLELDESRFTIGRDVLTDSE